MSTPKKLSPVTKYGELKRTVPCWVCGKSVPKSHGCGKTPLEQHMKDKHGEQ